MLTRRNVLKTLGVAGALVATPPLLGGCGQADPGRPQPPPGTDVEAGSIGLARADDPRAIGGSGSVPAAVSAVQGFTADLYRKLAAQPGNVVCSPYSVAVALAMTRNGARGRTASEMDAVLHAPALPRFNQGLNALTRLVDSRAGEQTRLDGSKGTVSMDVANSLWGQRGTSWEKPFLETLARYYGAGMRLVDYESDYGAARLAINDWTSGQTHGKIPKLLPPGILDALTRLVLVNAIYLKAPWETPLAKALTKSRPFTLSDGRRISPDTMQDQVSAVVTEGPRWRAARLPYAGGQLAMTVVVPSSSLADLEGSLDANGIQEMLGNRARPEEVEVTLPKWTFRLASPLRDPLVALGMPTAFDSSVADFSGMTRQESLFISAVQHEAFIAVDEEGTEAAAATAVIMDELSAQPVPPPFVVDRPFLFVIHDVDTATPLFIGRVSDPTAT
jgi:serpin B